ncbi:unnamed protein product [Cuscuta europaea]|uniref:Uncharacterized protein n=1 Tax=Cuscuta europaea TaxID=41803 RepID=A0A9P0YZF7_CUSEU|nr:unnamed protein product [Cuscuta europaea]
MGHARDDREVLGFAINTAKKTDRSGVFVATVIFPAMRSLDASKSLGTWSGGGSDPGMLRKEADEAMVPSHAVALLLVEVAELIGHTLLRWMEGLPHLSLADSILTKIRQGGSGSK